MAEEKVETREIRLVEGLQSGSYGIGSRSTEVEAGKSITVPRKDARVAVAGGSFEYVSAAVAPTRESLMKLKKEDLVNMAKAEGASEYIARLNKEQLAEYILVPAGRAVFEAGQEQKQQEEISKAADSGVEGEADANQ